MRTPRVGDIVIFRPDPQHPDFHDKGHGVELPAIVTKVWDSTVNLRQVDIKVFLDSNNNPPWVFGAAYSKEWKRDTWKWPDE